MTTVQQRLDFPVRKSSRISAGQKVSVDSESENTPTRTRRAGRSRKDKENQLTPEITSDRKNGSQGKKKKGSQAENDTSMSSPLIKNNATSVASNKARKSVLSSASSTPNRTPTITNNTPTNGTPSTNNNTGSGRKVLAPTTRDNMSPKRSTRQVRSSNINHTDIISSTNDLTPSDNFPSTESLTIISSNISVEKITKSLSRHSLKSPDPPSLKCQTALPSPPYSPGKENITPTKDFNIISNASHVTRPHTPCELLSPSRVSRRIFDDSPPNRDDPALAKTPEKRTPFTSPRKSLTFESLREPISPRKRTFDENSDPVIRSSPRKQKAVDYTDQLGSRSKSPKSPRKQSEFLSPRKQTEFLSPHKQTEFLSPRKQTEFLSPRKQTEFLSPRKNGFLSPSTLQSGLFMSPRKCGGPSGKPPIPPSPAKNKCPSTPNKFMSPTKKPVLSLRRPDATAYQKAKQVLHTALPDHLVGRDKEIDTVNRFISHRLNNGSAGSLYISGAPGTGKTAVVTHVLTNVKEVSKFKSVYINCMSLKDSAAIFTKITSDLTGKQTTCRSSKDAVTFLTKYFTSTGSNVILILDEIDQLDSHKQEVLYTMFEWPSLPKSRLILIGIANALDLTDRMLPRLQARPKCRPDLMNFTPYSKDQIVQIIQDRLQQISTENGCILEPSAIQFCARKVSAVAGDMRKALDVCRRAVEMVEKDVRSQSILRTSGCPESPVKTNSACFQPPTKRINIKHTRRGCPESPVKTNAAHAHTKRINIKHISTVVAEVYNSSVSAGSAGQALPLQQKLVICSLLLMMKQAKKLEITVGKLHETYSRVCRNRHMTPVDQSEFSSLCSLIETRGILVVKKAKDIRSSKILLKYDVNELEHALQDKMLISAILKENTT